MPYITHDRRVALTPGTAAENCGELNYLFSMLVLEADDVRALPGQLRKVINDYIEYKGLKYQHINDVMGALVGAKTEMVRRMSTRKFDNLFDLVADNFYYEVAAPYEDKKIDENGDLPYSRDQA